MEVTLLGVPKTLGGANDEAGHTVMLWRKLGWDVTIARITSCKCGVETASFTPTNRWYQRVVDAGCKIIEVSSENLAPLAGRTLVSFCNQHTIHNWPQLWALGCRLAWVPCMCYVFRHERTTFVDCPPHAVVFQSKFQANELGGNYAAWGVPASRQYRIHGALDLDQWPFVEKHREPADLFVTCRLARPDQSKWSRFLWHIIKTCQKNLRDSRFNLEAGDHIPIQIRVMGWTDELDKAIGSPPECAIAYEPDSLTAQEFLQPCHAMLCINSGDVENWPRVVLEAMASGVVVVAEDNWGYREQITRMKTGLMFTNLPAASREINKLARSESLRVEIAHNARQHVEWLTNPAVLGAQWEDLLRQIGT